MQRARADAIVIHHIAAGNGSQLFQIQIGVPAFQRIKRPFDQPNSAREGIAALGEFQPAAEAVPAELRQNPQHVGVEIAARAAQPRHAEAESDQLARRVERADHLALDLSRHHEKPGGDQICIRKSPYGPLQGNALTKLFDGRAFADHNVGIIRQARS